MAKTVLDALPARPPEPRIGHCAAIRVGTGPHSVGGVCGVLHRCRVIGCEEVAAGRDLGGSIIPPNVNSTVPGAQIAGGARRLSRPPRLPCHRCPKVGVVQRTGYEPILVVDVGADRVCHGTRDHHDPELLAVRESAWRDDRDRCSFNTGRKLCNHKRRQHCKKDSGQPPARADGHAAVTGRPQTSAAWAKRVEACLAFFRLSAWRLLSPRRLLSPSPSGGTCSIQSSNLPIGPRRTR